MCKFQSIYVDTFHHGLIHIDQLKLSISLSSMNSHFGLPNSTDAPIHNTTIGLTLDLPFTPIGICTMAPRVAPTFETFMMVILSHSSPLSTDWQSVADHFGYTRANDTYVSPPGWPIMVFAACPITSPLACLPKSLPEEVRNFRPLLDLAQF